MNNRKLMLSIVILVATIMVFSSALVIFSSPAPVAAQSTNTAAVSTGGTTVSHVTATQSTNVNGRATNVLNELKQKGIPTKDVYLPNFNAKPDMSNGVVQPLYSQSPAPMGIGDIGVMNDNGVLTPYTYNTTGFEGSFTLNNFSPFYLLGDAPYSATFQLNTVLNNVTILGNSSYVFWNQNVVFFSARTNQLTFLDNIWNFSSGAFAMPTNSILSGNGQVVPGVFYYTVGPTITVTYPFTVHLFLNSAIVGGQSAVYFNYSVETGGSTITGTYDLVLFNSTYGTEPGYSTPAPHYMVSGSQITPTGFLLNDAEIMVGGPGGGSTAMVYAINGTMNLRSYNATSSTYQNVRAAYDIGTDTGETSSGVAESWTNDAVAHLSAGPSFVYGMWNLSAPGTTMTTYSGNVNPSNAFMFVAEGPSFDDNAAVWSPLGGSSHYSFTMPTGVYTAEVLMSNYDPQTFQLGSDVQTNMHMNLREGVYTPLRAMNNAQVANISMFGTGTAFNPYVIMNNGKGNLNPLFGQLNDYAFPSFYGVLIMNTNVHIDMNHMPAFKVKYSLDVPSQIVSYFGLPKTNNLNYEMYNTSYVSLYGSAITGWFSMNLAGFPAANVIFWNSTHDLVGANYFNTLDSALLIYNDNGSISNNMVWGNYFVQNPGLNSKNYPAIDVWGYAFESGPNYTALISGLWLFSSGNLVYNNYFYETLNAANIPFNIYTYNYSTYFNAWNIAYQSAYYAHYFNGYRLSGSITGTYYQGGNFWWDWDGTIPYTEYGFIAFGGDYVPLTLHGHHFHITAPQVITYSV